MKRPLVTVALCYTVGLLLAEIVKPPLVALFAVAFGLLIGNLVWERARAILLWPLLIVTGWTNLASHTAVISPYDLRRVAGENPAWVTLRGTLRETPELRVYERDNEESSRTMAHVNVTALNRRDEWQPAIGPVMVTTPGELTNRFFAGQTVEISGVLAPPPLPVAEGLFNYRAYLAHQRIYYQFKADSISAWRLVGPSQVSPPFTEDFLAWAKHTLARGLPEKDEELRLLWAMTLGWKTALTGEVNEPFMRSGTMHIFAISGLHIALIAGILVALLRAVQLPRLWCGLTVIPLIWFYTAATGWQPSAIRSTIMMTVVLGGWALNRPSDLLNSLAAAALVILLWQPEQLFQASFQLSFFVVLSIALLMPPMEKIRDRLLRHDPLLPAELIPRPQRWAMTALRWLATSFIVSLAAWLGSLPLTAHYFHLFSPVTLLANLVIVPISSAALACNLGSLLCGGWLPWFGELFNHSAWFWMHWMLRLSRLATELPGAYFYIPSPPAWAFVAYYAVLISALAGWLFAPKWRRWSVLGLALVIGAGLWEWQRTRNEIALTVLPTNGGHALFVDAPGDARDLLSDCGATNAVEFVTKPFLYAQGVNRLPRLLFTHGDIQHAGGAELVLALWPVEQVITSPFRFRSPTYRKLLKLLEQTPDQHLVVSAGDTVAGWKVLHPAAGDDFRLADDAAMVLLGEPFGTRVLLLSDLGRPGQETLLTRTNDLHAEIVVTGLPEQSEALCDALLDAIQPKIIIVADSEFPATKRASPRLRERLAARGVPVIYTRESGAARFTFTKSGWHVRTALAPGPAPTTVQPSDGDESMPTKGD